MKEVGDVRRLLGKIAGHTLRPIDTLAAKMTWKGLRGFIVRELTSLTPSSLILNVGAGGRNAKVIESIKHRVDLRVISLDIDPQRGPDVVADIIDYTAEVQFDAIVMIEVLEHVKQPFEAIRNAHALLKPGGKLILSTPFLFPLHDRPMDYFRYTRYGLLHLCSMFGAVTVQERDCWGEVICVLIARLFREKSLSARLTSPAMVLIAALVYPFAILAGKVIRTDAYTTGYTLVATK